MDAAAKIFTNIGQLLTLSQAEVKGGRRVTESDLSIVQDAVLVSRAGRIIWVGREADLTTTLRESLGLDDSSQTISLDKRTVLPAFVEAHTHLIFAGSRAHEFEWRVRGETYQEIAAKGGGIRYTVNETRKASVEELKRLAQMRADVFLRQGVTALEVKSGYGLDLDTEVRSLKVARSLTGPRIITTYLGPHSASPDFPDLDSYLHHICIDVLPRLRAENLADRVDIYVEKGFFSVAQARTYLKRALELKFAITGHFEQFTDLGGADAALEFSPQSVDHLVYVSAQLISKLAQTETTAVLLPASDFYLRMDYPKARAMIDRGVRVALSTDFNPGTSPTQDLSLVGVLARLEMKMSLSEVLAAFTIGAAHGLGLSSDLGSLSIGKSCDFNVLSGDWQELFYSVGHHPVAAVYRAGNCVHKS